MKTSESLAKFAPAFLKAQKAMTFARKENKNPHFDSMFAGLPAVIDACKPELNAQGIVIIQMPSPSEDGKLHLTTRLLHESGEWIEDTAVIPLPKADPQGYGSAMTYGRRYSLAAACSLYQDDDDGQGSVPKDAEIPVPLPAAWEKWTLNEKGENRANAGTKALLHWWESLSVDQKKMLKPTLDKEWKVTAAGKDGAK